MIRAGVPRARSSSGGGRWGSQVLALFEGVIVRGKSAASALRTWMRAKGCNRRYEPAHDEDGQASVRAFIGLRSYGRPAWAVATARKG